MNNPIQLQGTNSQRIEETLFAFMRSQILYTAIDLDVFTAVAEGVDTLEALQTRLQLNERGLRILLNGLIGIGFLEKSPNGRLVLPSDAEKYLVRTSATYAGAMGNHCKRLYETWQLLKDSVRSGQPAGGAQSLDQLEGFFAQLVKGLAVLNEPAAIDLAQLLGVGAQARNLEILDVAGGSAIWSIALLKADPTSRATVLDFEGVLNVARETVAADGLNERFSWLPGDLEAIALPEAQYDLVLMANICHALGEVSSRRAFEKLFRTLKPGGKLVIVDLIADDARAKSGWPLVFSVNMLITTPEGDVFTTQDYSNWLQAVGFAKVIKSELGNQSGVIIAER